MRVIIDEQEARSPTMDEIARKIKEEPGYARSLLLRAGIIGEDGKLTKEFGGDND